MIAMADPALDAGGRAHHSVIPEEREGANFRIIDAKSRTGVNLPSEQALEKDERRLVFERVTARIDALIAEVLSWEADRMKEPAEHSELARKNLESRRD